MPVAKASRSDSTAWMRVNSTRRRRSQGNVLAAEVVVSEAFAALPLSRLVRPMSARENLPNAPKLAC